ncbi:hypothetical protein GCK72_001251 [Caenorhabditis remanei]|uniref:Uncharacterized protein n=1 Tax=Caenorhabditis remanei TaxID=31234 RepID=A0A6A5HS16_CAERE|nr:hypothetical protein GCK72_001251 [Caenorhabditis remanei]KAF1769434.1 hypothetical protein GCK72_001251 [Caenorhabditis remanei]
MGNLVKSYRALKKLELEESREWRICIIKFAQEKISVLIFCIVRSFPQSNNKHYIDFGEYVRDSLSLRIRSTDITLFACWYCILAICHISTHSIFYRYVKTIPLLERPLKTRIRSQTVFAIVFLTMNSIAALSGILLGSALVSIAFIHPDYSLILLLESGRMFIRCLYVVDRISMSVSKPRMYQLEEMKKLTDQEVSEIIANGCFIDMKRRKFQDYYIKVTLLFTLMLNALYGKLGLFNLKIAALGYFHVCEQMIRNLMNTEKYSATDLL